MSVFDVRDNVEKEISRIVFAEKRSASGMFHTHGMLKHMGCVALTDEEFGCNDGRGYVLVSSKEHAENLIKALEKAIEIGWLK